MFKDPGFHGIGADFQEGAGLIQTPTDIVHSAPALLEKCPLIKYERASELFQSTRLGKIALHYHLMYYSMMVYNKRLKPTISMLEPFRVFALSNEFKLIPIRQQASFSYMVLSS